MKKIKYLLIAVAVLISVIAVQDVYAADNYEVAYTIDEPVIGATMPTEVTATIKIDGESQGTQTFHLFWYETNYYQSSFKKATSTKFEPGKYYRPSIVDINFTTTTQHSHYHGTYEIAGPAYSNCGFMGKGTNVETGPYHLSNAFRCDLTLVEKVNGESYKVFEIEKAKIKEVNITIDTEIAGTESKKGEEWPCWYGEPGDKCYQPATYPTVTLGSNYKLGDEGKAYYLVGTPEDGDGYDAPFFGTFEEGKQYIVETYVVPADGYEFDDDVVVKVNGKTTGFVKNEWASPTGMIIYSTITATAKKAEVAKAEYKVLAGEAKEYKQSSNTPVSFEFDILYAKFLESGKVFVDGNLVDQKNYNSKEGSTIITLKKEYTDTLSAGKHILKVAVADGESTGTFTLLAAKTETETVPKTLDNIGSSIAVCVISTISLLGISIYVKKNA